MSIYKFVYSIVALQAHRSFIAIFNGETSEARLKENKERIVDSMKPAPRTITLNRTSIEDYLLVPRAIKAAIPSISLHESGIKDFLDANSAEKSKKKVLDQMLQQYSGIRYNRRIGSKIASRMKLLEMDK